MNLHANPMPSRLLSLGATSALAAALIAVVAPSCSVLLDKEDSQCERDSDCAGQPGMRCDVAARVCVAAATDGGEEGGDAAGGSGGGGVDGGAGAAGACTPAHPPPAPVIVDSPDSLTITLTIDNIDLGEGPPVKDAGTIAYDTLGYDLDSLCTTATENLSCKPPSWTTAADMSDMIDGRDNNVARMLVKAGQGMLTTPTVNAGMAAGERPFGILRVTGYSGLPADNVVRAEWYVPVAKAQGSEDAGVEGGTGAAGTGWMVDSESAFEADGAEAVGSTMVDGKAYVVDHMLVAHFDRIVINMRETPVEIAGAWVTGRLDKDSQTGEWSLKAGVMAGRMPSFALLGLLPPMINKILKVPVCTDSEVYSATKTMLCGYVDILRSGTPNPESECDAASIGIGMTAGPGVIGGVAVRNDPALCPPATDPRQDTCHTPPK